MSTLSGMAYESMTTTSAWPAAIEEYVRGRAFFPVRCPIHPSDPWPLPGHPEAMKMEPPRLFSHQCVEVEFSVVQMRDIG